MYRLLLIVMNPDRPILTRVIQKGGRPVPEEGMDKGNIEGRNNAVSFGFDEWAWLWCCRRGRLKASNG